MPPAIVTAMGIAAKYFSGIATPNNKINDTPSAQAILRNQGNDFFKSKKVRSYESGFCSCYQ